MKTIKINSIRYKFFNGFSEFKLDLSGKNAVVQGRNDDGKTSLMDGFLWLINGKNQNNNKFSPKPLDKNNQELLGRNPEVEAELVVDGVVTTLKRVQEENWTQPRGQLEKVRGSDTTKYYIDTVPKKEKEWQEFWQDIGDEKMLLSLVNIKYFMMLPWKERREILISMTGLTDEQIIEGDEELKELTKILDGKTIDDMKKILLNRKKEVLEDIKGVPIRIQENLSMISRLELGEMTKEIVLVNIAIYEKEVAAKQQKLNTVQNGDATLDYKQELSKVQLEISEAKTQFLSTENLATQSLQEDVRESQQIVNNLRKSLDEKESDLYRLEQALTEKQKTKETMLKEYKATDVKVKVLQSETFDEHQTVCPTCSQDLPSNQIDALMEKFNLDKSEKLTVLTHSLESVKVQGIQMKESIELTEKEIKATQLAVKTVQDDWEKATKQLDIINSELTHEQGKQPTFEKTDTFVKLSQRVAQLQMKIADASTDSSQAIREATEAYNSAIHSLDSLKGALNSFEQAEELNQIINDYKKQDADLKAQNTDIQRKLFLIEEFTRKKVKMLEESINDQFGIVKFKLFEQQKNGGLNEICEATVGGVEYSSGLNTSMRVKADIDIINALSKKFEYSLPVFIDNAEGINVGKVPETVGQRIELHVGENAGLKVEVA